MDKFVPDKLLKKIEKYKVTTFCAPPTIYRYFIKEDLGKYDLSSLKYATIAGEPLNPEVYYQFLEATAEIDGDLRSDRAYGYNWKFYLDGTQAGVYGQTKCDVRP